MIKDKETIEGRAMSSEVVSIEQLPRCLQITDKQEAFDDSLNIIAFLKYSFEGIVRVMANDGPQKDIEIAMLGMMNCFDLLESILSNASSVKHSLTRTG